MAEVNIDKLRGSDKQAGRRHGSTIAIFSVQHPWHALGNCGQQTRRSQKLQKVRRDCMGHRRTFSCF